MQPDPSYLIGKVFIPETGRWKGQICRIRKIVKADFSDAKVCLFSIVAQGNWFPQRISVEDAFRLTQEFVHVQT